MLSLWEHMGPRRDSKCPVLSRMQKAGEDYPLLMAYRRNRWCLDGCGKRVFLIDFERMGNRKGMGIYECEVCKRRYKREEL